MTTTIAPSPTELKTIADRRRVAILQMIDRAQSGHPGGSLSVIDVLTALFDGGFLRHDPTHPADEARDYFVLSKAHASPALYATLADRGFFDAAELDGFREIDRLLQGHPMQKIPGVEIAGGSLGQGLSAGVGIALGLQIDSKDNRVFVVMGDGELQEGQIWEAAMSAAKHGLGSLTAIVDANALQIDGPVADVMPIEPLPAKWAAFGWRVLEIDGHDMTAIIEALQTAAEPRAQPLVIIARTVKGKGAPAAEGNYKYHGAPLTPEHLAEALTALQK